jgi:hypothetical protein
MARIVCVLAPLNIVQSSELAKEELGGDVVDDGGVIFFIKKTQVFMLLLESDMSKPFFVRLNKADAFVLGGTCPHSHI